MSEKDLSRRGFLGKGTLALGAAGLVAGQALAAGEEKVPRSKILSHDERMEYRRLGKTDLMVSAISLGGHWKRLAAEGADFDKNRADVVAKCIDSGVNYVDACAHGEILAYSKALRSIGKRDKMYFGFSWYEHEMRFEGFRTKKALLKTLEDGMQESGLDYVDLWRVTCHEPGRLHTFAEVFEMVEAGEQALKDGKCRYFGISSHDRLWLDLMIKNYPIISVILTPYTADSKEKPKDSLFDAVRRCDVGVFGIKPYSSNSLFKGDSQPGNPHEKEDDERARMALRYILCNDAVTAPIPGLISTHQVDNCLRAIAERRQYDLAAAPAILDDTRFARAVNEMWDRLPQDYQWLRDWEWV
jgi:predicted aldo/keto reductase-like oxidoreductase